MGRWCACAAKACWGLKVQRQNITPASTLSNLARALASSFKRPGPVRALAPVTLVLPRVVVDAAHLARYAEVCGFAPSAQAPLTYPQMLTFPLVMTYMTSPACPWPAMGTVHLANAITQHAPLAAGDAVRVELSSGELLAHDKGQVFTLHLRVLRESDGEGDGQCVWQATQTLLRLGVKSPVCAPVNGAVGPELALTQAGAFDAPADTGRRYAPVSGDYNPIHLSALSARLFGFPRAIAHGLWTQARALALLQAAAPATVLQAASLTTVFKRPVLLPTRASLWQAQASTGQTVFEVRDARGEQVHLRSELRAEPAHQPTIS